MKRTQDVNVRFVESGGGRIEDKDKVRLEKTSLKSRVKRKGRKGGIVYAEEKEKPQEDSREGWGMKRQGCYIREPAA